MKNSKFLRALNLEENSIPPVWLMRQAGRYLPEYQAIRKNYSNFLDMCKQPRVCAELALQPIDRFDLGLAKDYYNKWSQTNCARARPQILVF